MELQSIYSMTKEEEAKHDSKRWGTLDTFIFWDFKWMFVLGRRIENADHFKYDFNVNANVAEIFTYFNHGLFNIDTF